jgi:hypothetical protein
MVFSRKILRGCSILSTSSGFLYAMSTLCHCLAYLLILLTFLTVGTSPLQAQPVRRLERQAINRTRITAVNGDTVQRFTTTLRHPRAKARRLYYWQGQNHIRRAVGAYDGHLLHGSYRLTDRQDHLLGSGSFRKGLKHGQWQTWRPDGSLASASRWRRGRQRGPMMLYDANSQPLPAPAAASSQAVATSTVPAKTHWWQLSHWRTQRPATPPGPKTAEPTAPAADAPAKPKKPAKKPAAPPVAPAKKTSP